VIHRKLLEQAEKKKKEVKVKTATDRQNELFNRIKTEAKNDVD